MLSFLLLIVIAVLVFLLRRAMHQAKKQGADFDSLVQRSKHQAESQEVKYSEVIRDLTERNKDLSRYEGIKQIDREIEERRHGIELEQAKAESAIQLLREEAEAQNKETKGKIRDLKREAHKTQAKALESASRQATQIVEEANRKADEVAGDAMVALRDSRKIEATAKAMKNIIQGYGDEYLVPSHSLLDDLAEEYSYKDAGVELKTARGHMRQMMSTGLAADCDYAEKRRKETAIHFVLDAFNGKVDTILSKVKHDNLGKLEQGIKDAFSLVNANGEAFRNARIRPAYMEARIAELRWAVVVNELRMEEREEQREIKEQMREEERARKEYERAKKEAVKEEKLLQDAMEKARKELEGASVEQQGEFQRKLEELEQKLQEAEEKNQRAISMAQQTKQGHVYVISNIGSFGDDVFKIGLTRRLDPADRVRELGDASVPFKFDIHAMLFSKDAPALETALHRVFKDRQMNLANSRKEFFRVGISDIKKTVQEIGIEAKWTMVAEAYEYRETLAALKAQGKKVRELPPPELNVSDKSVPTPPVSNIPTPATPTQLPKKKPQSPVIESPKVKTAPCPGCKGPLAVSTLRAGSNTCPHCSRTFKVNSKNGSP